MKENMRKTLIGLILIFTFCGILGFRQYRRAEASYLEGLTYFAKALRINSEGAFILIRKERGELFLKAIHEYGLAIKMFPFYYEYYAGIGNAYQEIGNNEKAKEAYKKAELLGWKMFDSNSFLLSKSIFHSNTGEKDKAKDYALKRADTLLRNSKDCYDVLEGAFIFLDAHELEKAEEMLSMAEKLGVQECKIAIENIQKRIENKR